MIVTELSKGIKLFLLVGGKGTRLKDVTGNTPKPLIDIHGKPFLSRVIESLSGFDITLVCSNENVNYFKNYGYDVLNEGEASGTAGWMLKTDLPESFYVMNGDTFFDCDINVDRIVSTIFTTEEIIEGDEGYIIGDKGKVSNFVEKNIGAKGYRHLVNTGIYKFYKKDLDLPSKLPLSLEYDILPNMNLTYQTIKCKKFDIGTPERLENFRQWFSI
tara:strand:- start:668 stop:1315 length:648 start_codon:yes stop_codon:yes gene_type:complete